MRTKFTAKFAIPFIFIFITSVPRVLWADTTNIKQCLRDIQNYWVPKTSRSTFLKGHTRTDLPCELKLELSHNALKVSAHGDPMMIEFVLQESNGKESRSLQSCKSDKEKMHLVFEQRTSEDFEKRERVQMTLLKRAGHGISLILSKRENKILRPLQQSSLICHLTE
jgi:hypothetical protein